MIEIINAYLAVLSKLPELLISPAIFFSLLVFCMSAAALICFVSHVFLSLAYKMAEGRW